VSAATSAQTVESELVDVCGVDELWDGEMDAFDVGDHEVLVVRLGGEFHAYDGICPHQSVSLVDGELTEEGVLICKAHQWQFDATCGKGVNPANECLKRFPIEIRDGRVLVGTEPLAGS
jgi:toluene monooxygenase system ferredoxin subunit